MLSSDHKKKAAKRIIEFKGAFWVCTGSVSRGGTNLSADLNECVPAGLYHGPVYDDDFPSYRGLRFTCGRFMNLRFSEEQEWAFTGREIEIKAVNASEKNLYRAMR